MYLTLYVDLVSLTWNPDLHKNVINLKVLHKNKSRRRIQITHGKVL